jgi:hypothetical protein
MRHITGKLNDRWRHNVMTPVRSKPVEGEKSAPYDASQAKSRRAVEK